MKNPASDRTLNSRFDWLKWAVVVVILAAGVVANIYFQNIPPALRIAAWIIVFCILIGIAALTAAGKKWWQFLKAARAELRRVSWPTRQEAVQTTLLVVAMVIIMALILWGIDSLLLWLVSTFTGRGG